jgi:hypothetical protein
MVMTVNNGKGNVASVALLEKPVQRVDEFDAPAFEGSDESLPYLQMLNQQDPGQAGFFITTENAEAVEFRPGAGWEAHTTRFQSGETAAGYRSLSVRMLVLRKSALMMFNRDSGDYIDLYRKAGYDRATMVLKTRYLVYLLDESNQLLHEQPLLFTTKGAMCGDFGEVYQRFRREMSRAFGQVRGTHIQHLHNHQTKHRRDNHATADRRPDRLPTDGPGPRSKHQRQQTQNQRKGRHQDRPQARFGGFNSCPDNRQPFSPQMIGKFDNQNRIFARQAIRRRWL